MNILITGAAGFIGFHVAKACIARGDTVIGFDNINDYYDVGLKEARINVLNDISKNLIGKFIFIRGNLVNRDLLNSCFRNHKIDRVIHLAAQPGVRYSLENPHSYIENNIVAFINILEMCRYENVRHLIYASSSSVYGANAKMPFSEKDSVNHPLQLYAVTKRSNELMAHSYSHLYGLPTTGLRFFTVYGPWGRPDMALFKFTKNIIAGQPIKVFNFGKHTRDFTYIDDIVSGVLRASDQVPQPDSGWSALNPNPSTSNAPFRIYNIGNSHPVMLSEYIHAIEDVVGIKAIQELLPIQAGDVNDTFADSSAIKHDLGYEATTSVKDGVREFVQWYRTFYKI